MEVEPVIDTTKKRILEPKSPWTKVVAKRKKTKEKKVAFVEPEKKMDESPTTVTKVVTTEDFHNGLQAVRVAGLGFVNSELKKEIIKLFKEEYKIDFDPLKNGKQLMMLLAHFANAMALEYTLKCQEILSLPAGAKLELTVVASKATPHEKSV